MLGELNDCPYPGFGGEIDHEHDSQQEGKTEGGGNKVLFNCPVSAVVIQLVFALH